MNPLEKNGRQQKFGPNIVITYPYPIGQASGGARMTREIARHLGRLGANVTIMPVSANAIERNFPRSSIAENELGFEFDQDLLEDGVAVRRVSQHVLHHQLDGMSVRRNLKNFLQCQPVDIVLSYYNEAAFLPAFLKSRQIKMGYISTWQSYAWGVPGTNGRSRLQNLIERKIYRRLIIRPHRQADILFATSQFTRGELIDILGVDGKRIEVSYLGVEPHFSNIPRRKPKAITRLVYLGRVVFTKGIHDAIEALGKLAAKGITDWNFRIVGPTGKPAVDFANKLARDYGINDKITYCGSVDDAGLRTELEEADLAIMPSHSESFGLVFAESQAAGVPVVAYKVGSLPEVIKDGVTGWLAPFQNIDLLAKKIEQAIQHPERTYRAGLAGRERMQEMFTWENTAATIFTGIQKVLQSNTGDRILENNSLDEDL